MKDERGGWKALDTGLVRDHLHAATAIGRMAAAAKAVEMGYGIEPDAGPSGRLGGWAIAGIPREAREVHAARSAQIDEAVGPGASYQARSVAARATRDRKTHGRVEDLVSRWRDELARAGFPPVELAASVERAGFTYEPPGMEVLDHVADELLSPGGRLASKKTFTRDDVIVAVAPMLHGLPVSILDTALDRVLSHENAVALPLVIGAREPVWAAAWVVEDERRVADLADVLAKRQGPRVDGQGAFLAVRQLELSRGMRLSERQAEVAKGLLSSGHSLDLVLGVAGSGMTTTLAAVRAGFESAGYKVIGAATAGQAAKQLGEGAGMESRTVASLGNTWRTCAASKSSESAAKPASSSGATSSSPTWGTGSTCEPITRPSGRRALTWPASAMEASRRYRHRAEAPSSARQGELPKGARWRWPARQTADRCPPPSVATGDAAPSWLGPFDWAREVALSAGKSPSA